MIPFCQCGKLKFILWSNNYENCLLVFKKKWVKTPPLINFMHVGKRNRSRSTDIYLCQMRILCPLKLWMLSVFRLLKLRCIFSETVTSCTV